jgi:hypothetical protein
MALPSRLITVRHDATMRGAQLTCKTHIMAGRLALGELTTSNVERAMC